jgi:AraC family transcriptional regulator of adaptative response / DNA-3-methyladenine glycosylase II
VLHVLADVAWLDYLKSHLNSSPPPRTTTPEFTSPVISMFDLSTVAETASLPGQVHRPPRLSTARMYDRMLASDPAYNGRFFTGVLTTGIYCLPSCKARKPKPQNVRFFLTCEAARASGLRPCKKCHPDDFARGADPVLETIETLVGEIRRAPASFPDVRAIVKRSGFGATRAFELFRQHFHTTPADILIRARVAAAQRLLLTTRTALTEIAFSTGFEALSVFHEHFRALTGLTPGTYRTLGDVDHFSLDLPNGYAVNYLRRALSRDGQSVTDRLEGNLYTAAVQLNAGPAEFRLTLQPRKILVEFSRGDGLEIHAIVVGLLGLDEPAAAFSRLARKLGLARLVSGREQLRISRTSSVFDGLLWAIIGQQINFAFACTLKRRLIERTGTKLPSGLYAPPTASAVAALSPEDLLPFQFSRQKADYVVRTARLVATKQPDLESLRFLSATRAERTLLALKGLGPWSVNYLMMRSLGFADCVPLGDTGVTSGLQSLLKLEERPDIDATRRLMAVFSPYRSLATAHLWQLDKPIPE